MQRIKLYAAILFVLFSFADMSSAYQQAHYADNLAVLSNQESEGSIYPKQSNKIILDSLIKEALMNNPKIHAVESMWKSAKLHIQQAGAWMDPKLNFNIANFPISEFDFSVDPMTQKRISLMQTLPFPGISSLKEQIATEKSEIIEHTFSDTRNSIVKDVSLVYYDIYLIDTSIEITLKNKQVLNDFIAIASKKYEVGKGLQQDVLKAHVEFSRLLDKLVMLRKRREGTVAALNALLNRPTTTVIEELEDVKHIPIDLNVQSLQNAATANRPMLKAMQTKIEQNKSSYELAKKQYWPDIAFLVTYGQRNDRRDFLTAQFSLNIPIWQNRKQDRKVDESLENIRVAEKTYDNSKNTVDAKIAILVASMEETHDRIQLLNEIIIPQATQSLNSAIAGYQVNKIDFLTLLNNLLTIFSFELDYYRLLTTYKKDASNLEFIVGQPLTNQI